MSYGFFQILFFELTCFAKQVLCFYSISSEAILPEPKPIMKGYFKIEVIFICDYGGLFFGARPCKHILFNLAWYVLLTGYLPVFGQVLFVINTQLHLSFQSQHIGLMTLPLSSREVLKVLNAPPYETDLNVLCSKIKLLGSMPNKFILSLIFQ